LTERLTHGWFCVRNRTTTEILSGVTIEQRHENERKFFGTAPWNVLDKKRVGISSLKISLGRLLSDHVANEFPEIRKEIDDRYSRARKELEQLGAPRQTTHEQMQYLIRLAGAYQRQVEDSLNGRYAAEGTHPSKLRMHVQNANEQFNNEMHAKGCTMAFRSTEESLDDKVIEEENNPFGYHPQSTTSSQSNARPKSSRSGSPVKFGAGPDAPANFGAGSMPQPKSSIYENIRKLYRTSRGTELPGHVNPTVLETLFAHQTINWQSIAEKHISRVIALLWGGLEALFVSTCLDDGIRKKIRSRVDPEVEESVERAREELQRILNDERTGPLITNNHYFADNLAKARAERFVAGLKKLGFEDGTNANINFKAMTAMVHLSNEASAIHDIHDTLAAYYKVALKRFIDNVVLQVVERNLLGLKGPVSIFTPDYIGALSAGDLASIAAEGFATSNTRTELRFQISRLEEARKVCSGRSSSNGV